MSLLACALSALATPLVAQSTSAMRDTTTPKPTRPSADLITLEQVQSRTFPNAYAAVEALHSNWLRARNLNPPSGTVINPGVAATSSGSTTASAAQPGSSGMPRDAVGIQVYLDGTRVGGIDALKAIPIANVFSILRISGTDAQARFGIGHSDGVIYVSSGPNKGGGH